jgi:hypothetical protein
VGIGGNLVPAADFTGLAIFFCALFIRAIRCKTKHTDERQILESQEWEELSYFYSVQIGLSALI